MAVLRTPRGLSVFCRFMRAVAFLQYNSGVNGVAFDAKTITLHATEANRDVAAGDVLTFDSTAPGTGIADPGGMVIVEITKDTGDA